MKVTTEELERCDILLTIEFDPKKEQDLLKKAAKRIAREVNIPGFRRGKAPYNTVVRRFGLEVVQQEALENMSDKIIKDALDEADVQPYAQIQLEEVNWDPLVITIIVPTKPKVKLGNYREFRLEAEPVEVTDEDVEDTLKALQEQNATWTPVERPAEIGDLVSMTVTEQDGDEVLVENESVEYELTEPDEEDNSRPDLTTQLLGLSAGESKTFNITYPEDFNNEDYAGKEITVSVEVSGVKVKELDPLDDEFAQQVDDVDTLEELNENIRHDLIQQREQQRDTKLGADMVDKIIESAEELEWPLVLEDEEIDEEIKRSEQRLKELGLTIDSYLQMQKKTREEWREEIRASVVSRLKRGLVLGKVAELEGLEVSHSEILEQAKLIADISGGGEQLWRNILASENQQNFIANDVISRKAIDRLAAIAKGEAPDPGTDEEAPADVAESDSDGKSATGGDEAAEELVAEAPSDEPTDVTSKALVEEEKSVAESAEKD